MSLPWPIVQLQGDLCTPGLGEVFHRRAFGDVLPNEPVRVLVRAALPRVVGRSEVEGRTGGAFDVAVAVKLGSVVDGDRLEQVPMGADELDDSAVGGSDRSGAELAHEQAPGYALDKADHAVAIKRAHDRVHLPVADLLAQVGGGGTLGDVALAGEAAALLGATVAFPPLRRLAKKPKHRSSSFLVTSGEPIDGLVADREPALEPQSAADLLGA